MEEEVVALYQARQKRKELEEGSKAPVGHGPRESDDETILANLKGSPLGVGSLEEVQGSAVGRWALTVDY